MSAVVLVIGFDSTRLRPLTKAVKKELPPLADRPILDHMLDRLVRHGVQDVVISSPHSACPSALPGTRFADQLGVPQFGPRLRERRRK